MPGFGLLIAIVCFVCLELHKKIFLMSLLEITDAEFQEALETDELVLAYFWATWCGPCRLVAPSVTAIATEYGDRLKVVKLNIDPNPLKAREYKVEGVPAFRFFKNKELIASHEGAITKEKLKGLIDGYLN
jgi:thioredoxin 1